MLTHPSRAAMLTHPSLVCPSANTAYVPGVGEGCGAVVEANDRQHTLRYLGLTLVRSQG